MKNFIDYLIFGEKMFVKNLRWLVLITILLIAGCKSEEYNEFDLDRVRNMEAYLESNIGFSSFGGDVFCAYEALKTRQGADDKLYVWVMCQEYYLEDDNLSVGSGISLPVVLYLEEKTDYYEVVQHLTPGDGTLFASGVKDNFPKDTWGQIFPDGEDGIDQYNQRAKELERVLEENASVHFGQ